MIEFRRYEKIHRLGKEETDGILDEEVTIQEKIDGANTSIWLDNGDIKCASRNQLLVNNEFNGFVEYAHNHAGIRNLLTDYPQYRLYGEWLVRHTIKYKETAYKIWYLFDIFDGEDYLAPEKVAELAERYHIETPHVFDKMLVRTEEDLAKLKGYVGQSVLGDKGEGIVIKRPGFRNQFGDHCYAKLVHEEFMEENAVVFGGNNKFSPTYWEMWAVNKYMTLARIKKVMNKIQPEINERLDMKHIPRICGTAYHDLLTEEIWDIAQNVSAPFSFKDFQRLSYKKAKQIYVDILNDSISIADDK